MATQFIIGQKAIVKNHLCITIDTNKSSNDYFKVKVESFLEFFPKQLIELFNLKFNPNIDDCHVGIGHINQRVYSDNIHAFLDSFEAFCKGNLVEMVYDNNFVIYTYQSIKSFESFEFNSYQQDEITVQFDSEEIIIYVDGKELPDALVEISSTFSRNLISSKSSYNSRVFKYSINPGFFNIKELVKQLLEYLGENGYIIVNSSDKLFCIDLRNDHTKSEIVSVDAYSKYIDSINFDVTNELSPGELLTSFIEDAVVTMLPHNELIIDVK